MSLTVPLQPDQDALRWDDHVDAYERVFEPLTTRFAAQTFDRLGPLAGRTLLDVAAGAGGAALEAAARGASTTAIDAAPAMVRRIAERDPAIAARVMDGNALAFPDASFDIGFSGFGLILFPDPAAALAELVRTIRPGGRIALVAWTEPQHYALVGRLFAAITSIRGAPPPPGPPPAQLRFVDPARFHALLAGAGLRDIRIARLEADLVAPSAADLATSLDFAPGMAATLAAIGPDRVAVLQLFARSLTDDQGRGPVRLGAVAHAAFAVKPN